MLCLCLPALGERLCGLLCGLAVHFRLEPGQPFVAAPAFDLDPGQECGQQQDQAGYPVDAGQVGVTEQGNDPGLVHVLTIGPADLHAAGEREVHVTGVKPLENGSG